MCRVDRWVVRVFPRESVNDHLGRIIYNDIKDLGFDQIKAVISLPTYIIKGKITEQDLKKICDELLTDPIIQTYSYSKSESGFIYDADWVVEVNLKLGVTDATGEATLQAIKILGVEGVMSVSSGTTYLLYGDIDEDAIRTISIKCLANPIIHDFHYYRGRSRL